MDWKNKFEVKGTEGVWDKVCSPAYSVVMSGTSIGNSLLVTVI